MKYCLILTVKNQPAMQETWTRSLVRFPWRRRAWQPTPVFWPGEFHGQRSLVGYSPWGHKDLDTAEQLNKKKFLRPLITNKTEHFFIFTGNLYFSFYKLPTHAFILISIRTNILSLLVYKCALYIETITSSSIYFLLGPLVF